MPKVSIVIPVYNVEDYLALSLESVRYQTLDDIEIICVDDGSTDSSLDVLDRISRLDSRVTVFSKENGGVSSARNVGIRLAKGDIVCTFDPDDLMEETACETLVRAFDESDAQAVVFGAFPYPSFGGYDWLDRVLSPRYAEYTHFEAKLLFKESSSPYAWRTACRRDSLLESGTQFNESLPCGEDLAFQFALYPRLSRVTLIPDKLIHYRVSRKGSAMDLRLSNPSKMAHDHVSIVSSVFQDWKNLGILDSMAFEALDWASDFVMLRVFQLDEKDELPLLDPLKSALASCFDEQLLLDYAESGVGSGFVNAIVFDRGQAIGSARRKVVHRYLAATCGRRFVAKMLANRVIWDGPWGKPLAAVKNRLNAKQNNAQKAQWDEWEQHDEAACKEALERLRSKA